MLESNCSACPATNSTAHNLSLSKAIRTTADDSLSVARASSPSNHFCAPQKRQEQTETLSMHHRTSPPVRSPQTPPQDVKQLYPLIVTRTVRLNCRCCRDDSAATRGSAPEMTAM